MSFETEKYKAVREYIANSWEKAKKDKNVDPDFPMPYDYIAPCVDGELIYLYYWDTYFTNVGLYLDGHTEYAFNNIECLKYSLRKFGCVPNMCRANGAEYASQPPLLFLMVEDYYEHTGDKAFLLDSYNALQAEYVFWSTKRFSESTGLNRYGTNHDYRGNKELDMSYIQERLGLDTEHWTDEEKYELKENLCSEGESGEDHTPRFLSSAKHVNSIDLNSYLYGFECAMAKFSKILEKGEEEVWKTRAETRLKNIQQYCLEKRTGIYFDYFYFRGDYSGIYCVACYLPFVFGITKDRRALQKINEKLVNPYGVVSCEQIISARGVFQWGYPNAWAPHQYWAYQANKKAGDMQTAEKIAKAYLDNVTEEFEKSGKLFEKYDGVHGGPAMVNEYGLPEMLGWTAGVFNYFYEELKN